MRCAFEPFRSDNFSFESTIDEPTFAVDFIRITLHAHETNVHCQSSILIMAIRRACAPRLACARASRPRCYRACTRSQAWMAYLS